MFLQSEELLNFFLLFIVVFWDINCKISGGLRWFYVECKISRTKCKLMRYGTQKSRILNASVRSFARNSRFTVIHKNGRVLYDVHVNNALTQQGCFWITHGDDTHLSLLQKARGVQRRCIFFVVLKRAVVMKKVLPSIASKILFSR